MLSSSFSSSSGGGGTSCHSTSADVVDVSWSHHRDYSRYVSTTTDRSCEDWQRPVDNDRYSDSSSSSSLQAFSSCTCRRPPCTGCNENRWKSGGVLAVNDIDHCHCQVNWMNRCRRTRFSGSNDASISHNVMATFCLATPACQVSIQSLHY